MLLMYVLLDLCHLKNVLPCPCCSRMFVLIHKILEYSLVFVPSQNVFPVTVLECSNPFLPFQNVVPCSYCSRIFSPFLRSLNIFLCSYRSRMCFPFRSLQNVFLCSYCSRLFSLFIPSQHVLPYWSRIFSICSILFQIVLTCAYYCRTFCLVHTVLEYSRHSGMVSPVQTVLECSPLFIPSQNLLPCSYCSRVFFPVILFQHVFPSPYCSRMSSPFICPITFSPIHTTLEYFPLLITVLECSLVTVIWQSIKLTANIGMFVASRNAVPLYWVN